VDGDSQRAPRCLGCLNFTGFSPVTPPDDFFPDLDIEHVFTCRAFPGGIPADILGHRLPHYRPHPGQEGERVYEPREPAEVAAGKAAGLIGCSPRTVRGYLTSGLLWGVKRGGRWMLCAEEIRLFRRPGSRRRAIPPGFFGSAGPTA
jgi:hypothetical protein